MILNINEKNDKTWIFQIEYNKTRAYS